MTDTIIIGGAGRWAQRTYLPLFKHGSDHHLIAVADLPDALRDAKADCGEVVELTGDLASDLATLSTCRAAYPSAQALIVATPPVLHDIYTEWGIRSGLSVICDKPPCAARDQFGHPQRVSEVEASYQHLLELLNGHPNQRVYVPLRRRIHDPYAKLAKAVAEVATMTGQALTTITIHHNNGCYRYPNEYALPGAHGYTDGLGSLTHTGYHLLDFLAYLVGEGDRAPIVIDGHLSRSVTVADAWDSRNPGFDRLVGRSGPTPATSTLGAAAELDLTCHYRIAHSDGQITDAQLDLTQRGCTRRTSPVYPPDTTHDEGRVDDTMIILHQGPLQTLTLTVVDDTSDVPGSIHLTRRLHPTLAAQLGYEPIAIQTTALGPEENARFQHRMISGMLDTISGGDPTPYTQMELPAQALTIDLYTATLRAGHRRPTTNRPSATR